MLAEARASMALAVPMALANLMQMAVYAVDVIFVARLGQKALAASSLGMAIFALLVWSLFGLTGAVAPLVAAEMGARQHAMRAVRRSTRMALWLAVGLGAGAMLVAGQGRAILLSTGQQADIATQAGAFLDLLRWAMVPMLIAGVLRNIVSALGRPVFATIITALAIASNAAGNYALVFGHWGLPAMGLAGSAVSNIVTAVAMMLAYMAIIHADPRLRRFHLLGRWWRADWARMRAILRVGAPIAGTILAEGGLFNAAALLMGRIGETELAAHTLALQIAAFAFQVPMGLGQAAAIRVGYHYGAGDRAGIARAGQCALVIGVMLAMVSSAIMAFWPRLALSAYIDVTAAERAAMVALAVRYLTVAAAFQLADATQAIFAGALRGLQDTRWPMGIAIAGYWLPGFGLAAGLGLFTPMGGFGVWIGLAVGLLVVAVLLGWRWGRRSALGLLPG